MRDERKSKKGPQKKTARKILLSVLTILCVLILLVVFVVPVLVSSGKCRSLILAKVNDSIDGKLDFASLSMGWWKGIKITDLSFNDSAGQTSVEVKRITTKPRYRSMLMGNLSFGETIIDKPRVEINLKTASRERAGGPTRKPSEAEKLHPVALPVQKIDLVVNDGSLKVTDARAQTVELSRVNSTLNLRPPGQQTNFKLDMAVVDAGKKSQIRIGGRITPERRSGWSLKGTSGNLNIEVSDLDLESLGPFFALAGVDVEAKGRISAKIDSGIRDGQFEDLTAKLQGKGLNVKLGPLKGDRLKSDILDVNVRLARRQKAIDIQDFDVKTDWLKAQASGVIPTTFDSFTEFVKSDASLTGNFELDVAEVFSQLPQTLGAKKDMKVTGGRVSGNIETTTRNGKREINGSGSLIGLAGVVGKKKIALSEPVKAEVKITSDDSGIKYDKLDVSAPFADVNCTGSSELLKYNANIDLARLQSELGQFVDTGEYRIGGELSSRGEVSIKEKKIAATGTSTVRNLRLSSAEGVIASEPTADVDFSVDIERDKNILHVASLDAKASLGEVSVKDALLPLGKEAAQPIKLTVVANRVDLAKVQPFAVLFASLPKEMQLAGMAESNISVTGTKKGYRVTTEATHVRNLKVDYPGKKPFEQEDVSIIFDAEINPDAKTIAIEKLQVISPQIKIRKGQLSKTTEGGTTKLAGRIECEYDWSAVSTVAGPFLPEGLRLEGQREDTISFASEYPAEQVDKLLENLNMDGKFGFEKAHYMGLNFGPTDVDVRIQNGLLKIAPFSTTVNNGQLSFAGEADFKQKPTVLKTPGPIEIAKGIEINDETTRKLLMYLNPIFAGATKVTGVANFSCDRLAIPLSKMDPNKLEVVGTISIDKLRLEGSNLVGSLFSLFKQRVPGQDFTIRPTRFVVRDGLVRYDDMQIDVGDNPFNFKGVIGLDKSLKNMTVTTPYYMTRDFKFRTAQVDEEIEGQRISLELRGTTEQPRLDSRIVDKLFEQLLKKQLEERLRDTILDGLEKLLN